MIENILQLVKEFGETHVVANPEVPNEHNETVMAEAGLAVAGTLQQALAGGNLQDIMNIFQGEGEPMSNPLAKEMEGNFVNSLTGKLGFSSGLAKGLAATLLPMIITTMVKRTLSKAPQDNAFNVQNLIGSLIGGGKSNSGLDIGSLISQFTGGGKTAPQPANNNPMNDLIRQFTGGGGQNAQAGLMDVIQGFFKK